MFRAATRFVVLATLSSLALMVPLVHAQQAEPADLGDEGTAPALSARTEAGIEVSTELRSSYLTGRPLLVTLRAHNPGSEALDLPRLDLRPHLVRFELVSASGKKTTRFNTPPDEDEDLRWLLPARGTRQLRLEVPASSALSAGRYEIGVLVEIDDEQLSLGGRSVVLEPPLPVAADVTEAGASALGWQVPWVHQGGLVHDLYLHTSPSGAPDARGADWHLASLPEAVEPLLSLGRSIDGANRFVYWRHGERGIAYARLEERRLRHEPREIGLPYPSWELLARAGGDAEGGLHVPIWIPAPSGSGGEVRVVSIDSRGQPRFQEVVALDAQPAADCWVDGAGRLRLLLHHGEKLDLYTLSTEQGQALPAAGRRLLPQTVKAGEVQLLARPPVADAGSGTGALVSDRILGFVDERLEAMTPPPVLGVRFGTLPERADHPGGTAIFAWLGDQDDHPLGVPGIWLSVNGRVIATVPGVPLPRGHRIIGVLPAGYAPYVLVSEDHQGVSWARSLAWDAPVRLGALGPHDALRFDDDGRLWSVRLQGGRGVVVEPAHQAPAPPIGP